MPEEKITVKGDWWQAHQPDKQLRGHITYGPLSGAEVDLFGDFENSLDPGHKPARFTLQGTTHDNKPISLFDCLVSGGQTFFPGSAASTVRSLSGIVGGHYSSLEDVRFQKVSALFTELRDWVWTTGIKTHPGTDDQLVNVTYSLPAPVPLGQIGPLTISIRFTATASPGFHTLSIEQDCALHIEADSMQPYAAFADCISSFQQFLPLALQRSAYPTKIAGRIEDTPYSNDFLVIRSRSPAESKRPACTPHDFLFTSHELTSTPAEAFTRFVDRQKELAASMDFYFTTVHHKLSLPRVRFLTLAPSLEAYHRATQPGRYIDEEAYQKGLRKLLWDAIPKDDQIIAKDFLESLATKLNYLHEFSLRKRLKELATKHRATLESLIGTPEAFSAAVADKRNQLTHASQENRGATDDFHTLLVLCDRMALLLEVCLLDEIGFTPDRLKQTITTRSNRARSIHQGWV
jgi:hypothetical protein